VRPGRMPAASAARVTTSRGSAVKRVDYSITMDERRRLEASNGDSTRTRTGTGRRWQASGSPRGVSAHWQGSAA